MSVPQVIDELPQGFLGSYPEGRVEALVGGDDLQTGIQHQQRLPHGLHNILGVFPGVHFRFQLLAQGDILHGQQDDMGAGPFPEYLPSVKEHGLLPDFGKLMFHFIAVEQGFMGEDILQEEP